MQTLLLQHQGPIRWIRFYRPDVRNAVNPQMMAELEQTLTEIERDKQCKVVIFSGDERAFVSGGDVDELHKYERQQEIQPIMERMGRILERIHGLTALTIACVEGVAVGGGCEIIASCDLCFASPAARFGMIQVKLGITTGWGGAARLMHKIGTSAALSMLLTGRILSASEAKEAGLVDELIEGAPVREAVAAFAGQAAQAAVPIIAFYKRLAQEVKRGTPSSMLFAREAEQCAILWETEEHRQAVKDFLERRKT
ncbi:enoyl-CoA hydratase/isomerase family protein [Laceyella putida]|uniref:Enoyl-CoA hydratase/isomerase family protein n=1 Tax=Laceyella putida TaxID=110101 RepID=A0ABW2RNI3_9BACL